MSRDLLGGLVGGAVVGALLGGPRGLVLGALVTWFLDFGLAYRRGR